MKRLIFTAFISMMIVSSVFAENNQTVVVGVGLGLHSFAGSDDLREGSDLFGNIDEVRVSGVTLWYIEWYVFGNIGFGFNSHNQTVSRSYTSGGESIDHKWNIDSYLVTLNLIPLGGTRYARMGIFVGTGTSTYKIEETVSGTSSDYEASESVSGPATTAGIYIDWGGEGFGMRAGYKYLATNFPDIETSSGDASVSASGGTLHLDFRWAF